MLEILELSGRCLMGLVRAATVLEHVLCYFLGAYWLISPGFRENVRSYEPHNRFAVYFGAVSIALLACAAVLYLAFGER